MSNIMRNDPVPYLNRHILGCSCYILKVYASSEGSNETVFAKLRLSIAALKHLSRIIGKDFLSQKLV